MPADIYLQLLPFRLHDRLIEAEHRQVSEKSHEESGMNDIFPTSETHPGIIPEQYEKSHTKRAIRRESASVFVCLGSGWSGRERRPTEPFFRL